LLEAPRSMAEPILDWILNDIPKQIDVKLFDDVSFIYEAQLARMELSKWWNDLNSFRKRTAYFEEVNGEKSYHYYISDIKGKGQIGRTCQYLTHWYYPYKAKFHPQMIKALINWMGLKKPQKLLDPFVGSGTALIEAKTMGIDSIGIDINPVCTLMSKVKCNLLDLSPDDLNSVPREKAFHFFDKRRKKLGSTSLETFVEDNSEQITELSTDERIAQFYELSYLYALSDFTYVKRDMWKGFNENLDVILAAVERFNKLKEELPFDLAKADVRQGDAMKLPFDSGTIDGIITSPPYSIAVDYIKQDLHALNYLNIDARKLVNNMIGLRGKGEERIANYFADMLIAFRQMFEVLKRNAYCVILIGDVTFNGKRLPIHRKYVEFAEAVGFSHIGIIKRPILGGFARLRYEYILMFQKT